MSKLRFTTDHEWLRQDDDGLLTVGITAYAQDALGDVVFVQLPELGEHAAGSEVAVLESVKAASNILMPLDGEVVAINDALPDAPELVNQDPLGEPGSSASVRPTPAPGKSCSTRPPTTAC